MSQDFEELLESLNAKKVRYLIGGAHALAFHARPRATKDLDLFIAPTRANAERFIRALSDFFGGPAPKYVSVKTLLDPNLGRDQLIAEKTFFDRPQDRADVAALRKKTSGAGRTLRKPPRSRGRS